MTNDNKEFLDAKETSELLGISLRQVQNLSALDLLPMSRIESSVRYHRPSLIRWMLEMKSNDTQKYVMRDWKRICDHK